MVLVLAFESAQHGIGQMLPVADGLGGVSSSHLEQLGLGDVPQRHLLPPLFLRARAPVLFRSRNRQRRENTDEQSRQRASGEWSDPLRCHVYCLPFT